MNNQKYKDSTLIDYVFGDLDKKSDEDITVDLLVDDNLQKRVEDIELTLAAINSLTDNEWDDIIEKNEQFNDAKVANLADAKKIPKIKTFIGISIIILMVYLINLDNGGKDAVPIREHYSVNLTNESTEVVNSLAEDISFGAGAAGAYKAYKAYKASQTKRKQIQNNSHQKLEKCRIRKKIWRIPIITCS